MRQRIESYALEGALGNRMSDEIHLDRPPLDEVVWGVHFVGVKWGLSYGE